MSLLGNMLWILIGGGFFVSLFYVIGGIALCLTVIGIPFGVQCFKLAWVALVPFGKTVDTRGSAGGLLAILMNIIWLVFGGLEAAITHLVFALLSAITIIGLPFAKQHMKLLKLALVPFGAKIASSRVSRD